MRNLKITTAFTLIGFLLVFAVSCQYDEVILEAPNQVSFANDVLPIFNQSCNTSGCHTTGGIPPDLSPAKAYSSLIDGNYIDTITPENSLLYQWMLGNKGAPMPISGPNPVYNLTILAWIREGAENN